MTGGGGAASRGPNVTWLWVRVRELFCQVSRISGQTIVSVLILSAHYVTSVLGLSPLAVQRRWRHIRWWCSLVLWTPCTGARLLTSRSDTSHYTTELRVQPSLKISFYTPGQRTRWCCSANVFPFFIYSLSLKEVKIIPNRTFLRTRIHLVIPQ